jgi:hypothetical protein
MENVSREWEGRQIMRRRLTLISLIKGNGN